MRHSISGRQLGRPPAARMQLFKNLVGELVLRGRVKTTQAKAKAVRPLVERLVAQAKKTTLAGRREILKILSQERTAFLIDTIAPQFTKRTSGFSRIIRIGPRSGDNAEVVILEWTDEVKSTTGTTSKALKGTKGTEAKKKTVRKRKVGKKA